MHWPSESYFMPWYMHRMQSPSIRPSESGAPRWQQRSSNATYLPLDPLKMTTGLSRKVRASFAPSFNSWSHAAAYQQFHKNISFASLIFLSSSFNLESSRTPSGNSMDVVCCRFRQGCILRQQPTAFSCYSLTASGHFGSGRSSLDIFSSPLMSCFHVSSSISA